MCQVRSACLLANRHFGPDPLHASRTGLRTRAPHRWSGSGTSMKPSKTKRARAPLTKTDYLQQNSHEEEIGVRLLARTTRSVAPTDAVEELLRSLKPALTDIRAALEKVSRRRDKPAGRVRLVGSPLAAGSVLGPKLGEFARNYPDVVLDITTDESRVDLVAGGYDAGVHYGEVIEQDMVAGRVSPVNHGVAPGFRGVCDTVLTQNGSPLRLTITDTHRRVLIVQGIRAPWARSPRGTGTPRRVRHRGR